MLRNRGGNIPHRRLESPQTGITQSITTRMAHISLNHSSYFVAKVTGLTGSWQVDSMLMNAKNSMNMKGKISRNLRIECLSHFLPASYQHTNQLPVEVHTGCSFQDHSQQKSFQRTQ